MANHSSSSDEDLKKTSKKNRPWWNRGLRILGKISLVFFIIIMLLLIVIRSPWGQDFITEKLTQYVSDKTHTEVSVDKLFITFSGDIELQDLYLEDQHGDTLLYSESLQAAIPLWPIIKGNPISINDLEWHGLRANIIRKDSVNGFNYQFLVEAFASDSTATAPEPPPEDNEPLKIAIDDIDFSDFKINYTDAVTGLEAHLDLGQFHFQGEDIDLENMRFAIADIRLKNTNIRYVQTKPLPDDKDTTESVLPFLQLDNLKLQHVTAYYKSVPDGIEANVNIADFHLQLPKADLSQQTIKVEQLALKNSAIQVRMTPQNTPAPPTQTPAVETKKDTSFVWPNWQVSVASIDLKNNHLLYQNGAKPTTTAGFDPNYINLNNLALALKNVQLSKAQTFNAELLNFSFRQVDGLDLNQLAFALRLDPTAIKISDFNVETNRSALSADLSVNYQTFKDFINQPDKSTLALHLPYFTVDLNDVFQVMPDLKSNAYLTKLSRHKLTGQLKAQGSLAQMTLSRFLLNWGKHTRLETQGQFAHLTAPEKLQLAVQNFDLKTRRQDVVPLISEEELGIHIPKTIHIASKINGRLDDLKTQTLLELPTGQIKLNGHYANTADIAFSADLAIDSIPVGKIIQNPDIGVITGNISTHGRGANFYKLTTEVQANFEKLEYRGYDYSALKLQGNLVKGDGKFTIDYQDDNLDLAVNSKIYLDSTIQKITLNFKLNGADFYRLNLMDKKIRGRLFMDLKLTHQKNKLTIASHVDEGKVVYGKNNYSLGALDLSGLIEPDSTAFTVDGNFIKGKLRSNADPDHIMKAIARQFKRYYVDTVKPLDSLGKPVQLKINAQLTQSDLITEVFLPDIKGMDTLQLQLDFDQKKKLLTAQLELPYLNYADNIVNDLAFKLNSTADAGTFSFGFKNLDAGAFTMNRTQLSGRLKNAILNLKFNALSADGKPFYVTQTRLSKEKDSLRIHLVPDSLILNGVQWAIPKDNQLIITDHKLISRDFVLRHDQQTLSIINPSAGVPQNSIALNFEHFKLKTFLALFNPDETMAEGILQGRITATNPTDDLGLLADFKINALKVLQVPLGDLYIAANSQNANLYDFEAGLKGQDVDMEINGRYTATAKTPQIDLNLAINKFGLATIAKLSGKELTNGSGYISGNLAVKGNPSTPAYHGFIQFNDAAFKVNQLNAAFTLNNEKIIINQDRISFNNFSIADENQHKFYIRGSILTEDLSDPELHLRLNADNFQVMNSTKKDNSLYYGTLNFDANGSITGKMSFPIIDLNIGVNQNTNLTYVYTELQAAMQSREGIVEFVDKQHPHSILTRETDSTKKAKITGIQLHTTINVDKKATFNVIVDPRTGDNLSISGGGDLDFRISRNGQMSLTGRYKITDGHYRLSLYNLIKRTFQFKPGSTIVWHGNPMDASLNIAATYTTNTSAMGIMASQISGLGATEKSRYQQVMPFTVILNIDGTIDRPKLSFNLDMPEAEQGAIGGTVYARIKSLRDNRGELNKQVFSLLVLGRFYPASGSDGSQGGFSSIARDNLNNLLSDQLNRFSDRLMGDSGINLNFGLESYTDYQGKSVQQRTDLNISAQKKLFNDRLIVRAGTTMNVQGEEQAGNATPLLGNVSIEYLLTKDGRWRLRGFRKNEYTNIIDGQVFVNGIGLLFQREFNEFSELWQSFFSNPKAHKKQEKNSEKKPSNKETTETKDN